MTRTAAISTPTPLLAGLAWGLLAAAIWASYSVLARPAVKSGLSPGDLTLLRFAPGALLMAPLAHGAVIAPACQMLAGLTLSAWLAHQGWTRESALGAVCVAIGLACWGLFGAMSRRWQVDPLRLTAAVVVLAYSRAAALLGSGRAAFFGALVPGAASLLAIPELGEVPSAPQVLGIVAVVAGLLVAFGAVRLIADRARLARVKP